MVSIQHRKLAGEKGYCCTDKLYCEVEMPFEAYCFWYCNSSSRVWKGPYLALGDRVHVLSLLFVDTRTQSTLVYARRGDVTHESVFEPVQPEDSM